MSDSQGRATTGVCACCTETKELPIRNDAMGGYVCLSCVDEELRNPSSSRNLQEGTLRVFSVGEPPLTPEEVIVRFKEGMGVQKEYWKSRGLAVVYSPPKNLARLGGTRIPGK